MKMAVRLKRIFLLTIISVFILTSVVACTGNNGNEQQSENVENGYEAVEQPAENEDATETPTQTPEEEPVRLSIVTTIFPQYDWVRQILGDNAENMDITFVINSMIDLHSFNPSVSDIVTISTSDLFIYVGGESDDWIEDALRNADNPNMRVINLMDVLGDSLLEFDHDDCDDDDCDDHSDDCDDHSDDCIDDDCDAHSDDCADDDCATHGEECEDEDCYDHPNVCADEEDCAAHSDDCEDDDCEDHSDDCDDDDCDDHSHDHHHGDYDEHVWLSLRNAIVLSTAIADVIIELDPANAEMYTENLNAFVRDLRDLDEEFTTMVNEAYLDTVVFGDRFPFRYLMEDYGINYYAAFPGCHAEAEASFSTIIYLVEKVDENELHTILVTESADESIANTIRSHTSSGDQQILAVDSLQSVTTADAASGVTFLSIMRSNLEVLREALR